MKNTKRRILRTALDLFNKKGLAAVKLRTIANQMGISQGNLNYHFKKREDIVWALYSELVEKMSKHISMADQHENLMKTLFEMNRLAMKELYNYRFVMLDFVHVIREHEKIRIHFRELMRKREEQFIGIYNVLISQGIMIEEELPNQYANLNARYQILGDFWISSAEIKGKGFSKKSMDEYHELFHQAIYPYLTEKGKKEYHKIVKLK